MLCFQSCVTKKEKKWREQTDGHDSKAPRLPHGAEREAGQPWHCWHTHLGACKPRASARRSALQLGPLLPCFSSFTEAGWRREGRAGSLVSDCFASGVLAAGHSPEEPLVCHDLDPSNQSFASKSTRCNAETSALKKPQPWELCGKRTVGPIPGRAGREGARRIGPSPGQRFGERALCWSDPDLSLMV